MAKGLAFLVLLSSLVAAFCIALLCYTFVTGNLPFKLQPMAKAKEIQKAAEEAEKKQQEEKIDLSKERIAENYLQTFYQELKTEREKITVEKENLAEKQRNVDEIMKQARSMQEKIAATEKNIRLLLDFIDAKQQENLKKTAKLLAGMDTASAGKMVLQWEDKKAAQVLFFVNDKEKSKIISELMQSKSKADLEKVNNIVQLMQKISDQPGPGAEKNN